MESLWSVSKLSTESVGSRRELCSHRRRRRDKTAVCKHRRRDETRQFRLVGVGGVYWALHVGLVGNNLSCVRSPAGGRASAGGSTTPATSTFIGTVQRINRTEHDIYRQVYC